MRHPAAVYDGEYSPDLSTGEEDWGGGDRPPGSILALQCCYKGYNAVNLHGCAWLTRNRPQGGASMPAPQWHFGRFRLDPVHACLWRGAEAIALPPKAFDVLCYLVTHPDRLVTKDELLDAVWPETAVTDAVVRVAIGVFAKCWAIRHRTPLSLPPCRGAAIAFWRRSRSTRRRLIACRAGAARSLRPSGSPPDAVTVPGHAGRLPPGCSLQAPCHHRRPNAAI